MNELEWVSKLVEAEELLQKREAGAELFLENYDDDDDAPSLKTLEVEEALHWTGEAVEVEASLWTMRWLSSSGDDVVLSWMNEMEWESKLGGVEELLQKR